MQPESRRHAKAARTANLRPPNADRVHDRAHRAKGSMHHGLTGMLRSAVHGRALGRSARTLPPGAPRIEGAPDGSSEQPG